MVAPSHLPDKGGRQRNILITGAASGIGRAVTQRFIDAGENVYGLDINAAPGDVKAYRWIQCDLNSYSALTGALQEIIDISWDAIVLCAGIAGLGDIERVLQINFFSARRLIESLSPGLREGGSVTVISSGAGMRWIEHKDELLAIIDQPDTVLAQMKAAGLCASAAEAYIASKELLCCYCARSGMEFQKLNTRINSVSPGGVETPLIPDFTEAMGEDAMAFSARITGRHGTPEEIANVVEFLASPQAIWINGTDIKVDGGLTGALLSGVASFEKWDQRNVYA